MSEFDPSGRDRYPAAPPIPSVPGPPTGLLAGPPAGPPPYRGPLPPWQDWPGPPDAAGPSRPPRRRRRGTGVLLLALLFATSLVGGALVGVGTVAMLEGRLDTAAPAPPLPSLVAPRPPTTVPPSGGDLAAAAERVVAGAVDISTVTAAGQGAGTGMVIEADGVVLTNHHVVEGAYEIRVTDLDTGRDFDAEVVGSVPGSDVAVLRLIDAAGLDTVTVGDPTSLSAGDPIVAIGNSDGRPGNPQVSPGQVIGTGRSIVARDAAGGGAQRLTGLIHIRADIGPGDSGGPVANAGGEVIGLTTAASFDQRSGSTTGEGYVIPIDDALALAERILAGDDDPSIERGRAGVLGVQVSRATGVAGAAVLGVADGSGAEAAGVSAGSVITAVEGTPVDSAEALTEALRGRDPGERVRLTWTDPDGRTREATVTLGEGPVR